MADGAERIANFMGNASSQSAERSQFELLGLLGNGPVVLDKNQGVGILVRLQRSKVDSDFITQTIINLQDRRVFPLGLLPLCDLLIQGWNVTECQARCLFRWLSQQVARRIV